MAGMQPPPLPVLSCQRCDKPVAIVANVLLAICIVTLILGRRQRSKTRTSEQGICVDYHKAQGIAFRIAPIGNAAAATEKLISLAADDLRAQRGISSAVFVEAMIGIAVLHGGGLTHEGKPFDFSAENARLLLSRSLEICDFISEEAMELDNQATQTRSSAGAQLISPEELASRPARPREI